MSARTTISWCDSTFNYVEGCTKVSPGCLNCYAEVRNKRFSNGVNWGPGAPRMLRSDKYWADALRDYQRPFVECATTNCGWRGELRGYAVTDPAGNGWTMCPMCHGVDYCEARRRAFTSSVADVFDNESPDDQRQRLWALIEATPLCDWYVLTKRIGNARKMLPPRWLEPGCWPQHVRIGSSIVNQAEADRDIHKLMELDVPTFVSFEPLLEPIVVPRFVRLRSDIRGDFPIGHDSVARAGLHIVQRNRNGARSVLAENCKWLGIKPNECTDVDIGWAITGGESGKGARPANLEWFKSIRDQCATAGVPYHHKQNGEFLPADEDACIGLPNSKLIYEDGDSFEPGFQRGYQLYGRVGKKTAGRMLDGVEHNGFPVST